MRRVWIRLAILLGLALATVLVVMATPDNRIPVVSGEPFAYEEAARTLEEVRAILSSEPGVTFEDLEPSYDMLEGIERKEPSGLLWSAAAMAIGFLGSLALLRSGNRFGSYLVALALVTASFGLFRALADLDVQRGLDLPFRQLVLAGADTFWIPLGVIFGPLLILTFPNGRLVTRRWRWVIWAAALASVLLLAQLSHPLRYDGRALAPDYWPNLGSLEAVFVVGIYLWQLALLAASASLFIRFFRASGEERAQLTWVVFGLAVALVAGGVSDIAQRFGGEPGFWGPVSQIGSFVVLPASVLVTIFRFRLYDIDLVIHRTVLYASFTFFLAAAYGGVLFLAGQVVGGMGLVPAIVAMVAAALVFAPAHALISTGVERLVYPRRAQPYEALSALSSRLASGYDLDDGLHSLAAAAASGTGAERVQVWLKLEDKLELAASHPPGLDTPDGPALEKLTRVTSIGSVGYLGLRMPRGEKLRSQEIALVDDLAATAEQFTENVRLRDSLESKVNEAELRQAELLQARDRLQDVIERTTRELERDLHDGAQARAVSMSTSIGLARAIIDRPGDWKQDLIAEIDTVQIEVDRFGRGLYPPELRTEGVMAALKTSVPIGPNQVELLDRGSRTSPEVEAAMFFMGVEAVQNAVKHAPGSHVEVSYSTNGSLARLAVFDDGPGFEAGLHREGHGLSNMRERIESLGGKLAI